METGFVYMVFDTETRQYRGERHPTVDAAKEMAARLNAKPGISRFIVYPVSVYPH